MTVQLRDSGRALSWAVGQYRRSRIYYQRHDGELLIVRFYHQAPIDYALIISPENPDIRRAWISGTIEFCRHTTCMSL